MKENLITLFKKILFSPNQSFEECMGPMGDCRLEIELQHISCVAIFVMLRDRNSFIASTTDLAINKLEDSIIVVLLGSDKYQKETNRKIFNCTTISKLKKN